MKICSKCQEEKPIEEFQKRAKNSDGYAGMCKPCKRAYDNDHYANNPKRKQQIQKSNNNRRIRFQNQILEYLQNHPCVDCGETDPIVLDFDHQENKSYNISTMLQRGLPWGMIKLEMEKCLIRCANCHRRKTAKDFNWWRLCR